MNIIDNIQNKIEQLKKDEETMYAGTQFETQLNERMNDLELLEQEIDKVIKRKQYVKRSSLNWEDFFIWAILNHLWFIGIYKVNLLLINLW